MEDDFEDYGPVPIPPRRFRGLDVLILVLDSIEEFIGGFNRMLMSHANWKLERHMFEEQARADIEAIVSGE